MFLKFFYKNNVYHPSNIMAKWLTFNIEVSLKLRIKLVGRNMLYSLFDV